jgi:hypothetical protein
MMITGGKIKERRAAMLTTLIVFPVILMILGVEAAFRIGR